MGLLRWIVPVAHFPGVKRRVARMAENLDTFMELDGFMVRVALGRAGSDGLERDGVIGPGLIGAMSRDDSVDARHRGRRFEAHLERAEQRIKMIKIMTHRGVCHWQKQTFVYQTCNTIGRERTL